MVLGLVKSYIDSVGPKQPVKFRHKGDVHEEKTMEEIIGRVAPEMSKGYSYWSQPMLGWGNGQTLYTAIRKFEDVDKVYYKRKLMTVESDKRFYEKDGVKLRYDAHEGKSTVALDYVVSEERFNNGGGEEFRPESQTRPLHVRTKFMDPAEEDEIAGDESRPLVVLLHGLSGGSYESYVRNFLFTVTGEPYNFDAVVVTSRGCSRHSITSPQVFNGLWTNDVRYYINEHVKKKWPNKRIYMIGYSLGGAILANYLGQEGDDVYENIKLAAVVGALWDFTDSCNFLESSYLGARLYSPTMCTNLVRVLKSQYDNQLKHVPEIRHYFENKDQYKLNRIKDFDDAFTSKCFGFNSAYEYYRNASPINRFFNIRVPTLIINSLDDPVVGNRTLPYDDVKYNPFTNLITSTIGGHLGWFDYKFNKWYSAPLSAVFKEVDDNWICLSEDAQLPAKLSDIMKLDRLVL